VASNKSKAKTRGRKEFLVGYDACLGMHRWGGRLTIIVEPHASDLPLDYRALWRAHIVVVCFVTHGGDCLSQSQRGSQGPWQFELKISQRLVAPMTDPSRDFGHYRTKRVFIPDVENCYLGHAT